MSRKRAVQPTSRDGAIEAHVPQLTARSWELWELAASGSGMSEIGAIAYGTADWRLVGTVFHEAGHAAAARAHGQLAWITITSVSSGHCDRTTDRYWSRDTERIWALAGPVAEYLAKYSIWSSQRDIVSCAPQMMSDSDRILGHGFQPSDVLACAALLRQLWSSIAAESSQVLARELARWGATRC